MTRSRSTKAEVAARQADKILLQQYQAQLSDEIWMAEANPTAIERAARFVRNFDKREKRRRKTAEQRANGRASQPAKGEDAEMKLLYELFPPEVFAYLFEDRNWTPQERAARRAKMLEFQASGKLRTGAAKKWLREQIEGPKYYGLGGVRDAGDSE